MPDPSSALRQMIIVRNEFDTARARRLCSEITTMMADRAEAERLGGFVISEIEALALALELDQPSEIIRGFRDNALEAANRMIKAALG